MRPYVLVNTNIHNCANRIVEELVPASGGAAAVVPARYGGRSSSRLPRKVRFELLCEYRK
jgi:hypothetical protein